MLNELEFIEETEVYLKFRVNSLAITKLISFLVERGKRDEFHLAEIQLLLFSLNLLHPKIKSAIRDKLELIYNCLENQQYLSFEWDYRHFYDTLNELLNLEDVRKIIKGEFTSYKGINKADFQIQLILS